MHMTHVDRYWNMTNMLRLNAMSEGLSAFTRV